MKYKDEKISQINKNKTIKDERGLSFLKPTIDDIGYYCQERNSIIDAELFFDYYESIDWMIGNSKMKNWKACVRTWEKREEESFY